MKHSLINELLKRINSVFLLRSCSKRYIVLILGCTILVSIIFLPLQALSKSIENIQNPKESNQWVIDNAKVWSQETKNQLEKSLSALKLKNKTEFAIVTVENIPAGTDLRPIAKTLRQNFRIGEPAFDNGLFLLISKRPEKLIGILSKGTGIPTNYFQSEQAVISDNKIATIQRWMPNIIEDLSKVSYQSQPAFRQIYQVFGWVAIGLLIAGFTSFECVMCRLVKIKDGSQNELAGSDRYLKKLIDIPRFSIYSIALSKILGSIALSTFLLSKSPISGGLNTGNADFVWVIIAGSSMLPIHIIPDFWLRYRRKKIMVYRSMDFLSMDFL